MENTNGGLKHSAPVMPLSIDQQKLATLQRIEALLQKLVDNSSSARIEELLEQLVTASRGFPRKGNK